VDASFFKEAGDLYRKIRNTIRFLLSNLNGFSTDIHTCLNIAQDFPENTIDAYVLSLLDQFEKTTLGHYKNYQFRDANSAIYHFCNDTLSSFYLFSIKDRMYCDALGSERRIRAQVTLRIILDVLIRLLSPILPHTCDEVMESLNPNSDSIQGTPALHVNFTNSSNWDLVMETRKAVQKALENAKSNGIENSLDAGIQLPKSHAIHEFLHDLPDIFGVSRVEFSEIETITIQDLRDQHRCERSWKRDETVKAWPNGAILSERDYHAITQTH
jgi:isoleucyl-tRNA synthetase